MQKLKNIKRTVFGCLFAAMSVSSAAAQFTDVTSTAGLSETFALGAGWGDFNNDGCIDLLMNGGTSQAKLAKNNCDGTFTDVTAASGIDTAIGSWAVVWIDYNSDQLLDVYIAGGANSPNKMYKNNGDDTFTDVADDIGLGGVHGTAGAAWADVDGDGDLDLFTAGRFGGGDVSDFLYQNNNGVFTNVAAAAGVAGAADRLTFMGAFFDYDKDGDMDLYLSVDFGTDVLYANDGTGVFSDVSAAAGIGLPEHGMGVAIGDLNNDGCLDVASSNNGKTDVNDAETDEHGPSIIYLNNCDGTFTVSSYAVGLKDRGFVEWGVSFVDYDNDGDLDFSAVAGGMLNADGAPNAFYENDGSGQLVEITTAAGLDHVAASFGSIWADYDNDGDLDWFVASHTAGESKLYRNDSASGQYLKVKLVCDGGNVACVGATVKVTAGSRTQMRVIQAGVSYVGSEIMEAHFGLGVKDTVSKLTVMWPDGEMTEMTDVAAGQTIELIHEEQPPLPFGDITGMVVDGNGNPVSGVRVLLRPRGQSMLYDTVLSDENGVFGFVDVPADEWESKAIVRGESASKNFVFDIFGGEVINITHVMVQLN